MYDEGWEKCRAEAIKLMRDTEETMIKKWLSELGYTEPVGYYRNIFTREMEIYTKHPGRLIGKAGVDVHRFEKMLSEEFGGEWKVQFVEVRGGFVKV